MKCKNCGLEMELWQTTRIQGETVKRYRCGCGEEKAEIVGRIPEPIFEVKKDKK